MNKITSKYRIPMSSHTENKTLGFITDVTSGKSTSVFCLADGEGRGELCIH